MIIVIPKPNSTLFWYFQQQNLIENEIDYFFHSSHYFSYRKC